MSAAIEGKYGIITAEKKQFHEGEPVFLLRATDRLAPSSVREYAQRCFHAGCSQEHVAAAHAHADRIEKWQREHGVDLMAKKDSSGVACGNCGATFDELAAALVKVTKKELAREIRKAKLRRKRRKKQ